MSNAELQELTVYLEYDVSVHAANYIINMKQGHHSFKRMFYLHLLSVYYELIAQYDLDYYDLNPLNATEMQSILHHTNVIINKNYNYDFEQSGTAF